MRSDFCSDVEHRNSIDAASFRVTPETKSQPSASGCDLERKNNAIGQSDAACGG